MPLTREQIAQRIAQELKDGFYVTAMLGRGVNTVTGEYSRGANGLWIENGELTHAVGTNYALIHAAETADGFSYYASPGGKAPVSRRHRSGRCRGKGISRPPSPRSVSGSSTAWSPAPRSTACPRPCA